MRAVKTSQLQRRQVSITVSNHSTKQLQAAGGIPSDNFRQITA
jgi:hypothetical protein